VLSGSSWCALEWPLGVVSKWLPPVLLGGSWVCSRVAPGCALGWLPGVLSSGSWVCSRASPGCALGWLLGVVSSWLLGVVSSWLLGVLSGGCWVWCPVLCPRVKAEQAQVERKRTLEFGLETCQTSTCSWVRVHAAHRYVQPGAPRVLLTVCVFMREDPWAGATP